MISEDELKKRITLLQQGASGLKDKIEYLKNELDKSEKDLQATFGALQENLNWLSPQGLTLDSLKKELGADSIEVVEGK